MTLILPREPERYDPKYERERNRILEDELARRPQLLGPNTFKGIQTAPLHDKGGAVYNVKAFGAVGDGSADDSTAIQACADTIAAAGGGTMLFPPGSYLINTQIETDADDLIVDLGDAFILNTVKITVVANEGFDTNPIFLLTGERVRVRGGHFKDGLSQGIVITGSFESGDTYTGAGYTEGHRVEGTVFENCEGDSLHIRFFRNAKISNVTVKDKGAGIDSAHAAELATLYGTDAQLVGCSVVDSANGGGPYALYVDGLVWSGCYSDVTNAHATSKQSSDAYYAQLCKNIALSGSQGYCMEGGVAFKASHGCENVTVSGCIMKVDGTGSNPYATLLMQGVNGFKISDNDLFSPTAIYTVRAEFHSIPLTNSINGAVTNNRCTGGGIIVSLDTGATRGPVDVDNNRLEEGSIYMLQVTPSGSVSGNRLYTDTDYTTTTESAAIFVDRCYGVVVEKNIAINEDDTNEAKVGVLLNIPVFNTVRDNTVLFTTAVALSVGYALTGSPTVTFWENNEAVNAGQKYSGITTASQYDRLSADFGDSAATLTVGVDRYVNVWNTPLTTNRAVTLTTTGAVNGSAFRIVRTAAATGVSALNVGTGPLKALAAAEWCEVHFDGSAWVLTAFGSL